MGDMFIRKWKEIEIKENEIEFVERKKKGILDNLLCLYIENCCKNTRLSEYEEVTLFLTVKQMLKYRITRNGRLIYSITVTPCSKTTTREPLFLTVQFLGYRC